VPSGPVFTLGRWRMLTPTEAQRNGSFQARARLQTLPPLTNHAARRAAPQRTATFDSDFDDISSEVEFWT